MATLWPFNEEEFGDGSNDWVGGTQDFVGGRWTRIVTDPYQHTAGVADAAALNFDEGVGGITSTYSKIQQGDTEGANPDTSGGSTTPTSEGDYSEYARENDPRRDARNWTPVAVQEELNKLDAPEGFWTSTEAFQWVNQNTNLPDVSGNISTDYQNPTAEQAAGSGNADSTNSGGDGSRAPDPEDGGGAPQQPPRPPAESGSGALGTIALAGGGAALLYLLWKVVV